MHPWDHTLEVGGRVSLLKCLSKTTPKLRLRLKAILEPRWLRLEPVRLKTWLETGRLGWQGPGLLR